MRVAGAGWWVVLIAFGGAAFGQEVAGDDAAFLINPGSRGGAEQSFEELEELAPGAVRDLYGFTLAGTTSPEHRYRIDGLAVNDLITGLNALPLSSFFASTISIRTSELPLEAFGVTGALIDVTSRSGGDRLHGAWRGSFTPGLLHGANGVCPVGGSTLTGCGRTVDYGGTLQTRERLWNLGDTALELSGPILPDRVSLFAAVAPAVTRLAIDRDVRPLQFDSAGQPLEDANGRWLREAAPGTPTYFADQWRAPFLARVDYRASADHRGWLTVFGAPSSSGGMNEFGIDPLTGLANVGIGNGELGAVANRYDGSATGVVANWASAFFDRHLLLRATAGLFHQRSTVAAMDGSTVGSESGLASVPQVSWRAPSAGSWTLAHFEAAPADCDAAGTAPTAVKTCPVQGYVTGGPGYLTSNAGRRWQGSASATWLFRAAGEHALSTGLELEASSVQAAFGYSGRTLFSVSGFSTAQPGLPGMPGGPTLILERRSFVAMRGPDDAEILPSIVRSASSLSTGLFVEDRWTVVKGVTLRGGVGLESQTLSPGLTFAPEVTPRLGVSYDPTNQGKARVFAGFARHAERLPLNLGVRGFSSWPTAQALRTPGACRPWDPASAASCRSASSLAAILVDTPEAPNQRIFLDATAHPSGIAASLRSPSTIELSAGGELALPFGVVGGVSYLRRDLDTAVEDVSFDDWDYLIANPGRRTELFPELIGAKRTYDAVSVRLSRPAVDGWSATAGYTWSQLFGNYPGFFEPETANLDPNQTRQFDRLAAMVNRTGPLPSDRTHTVEARAERDFALPGARSVTVQLGYRGQSGAPVSALGADVQLGLDQTYILPRGSLPRLDWTHDVGAGVRFETPLTGAVRLELGVDVFNLFNLQTATAVDQRYTSDSVPPIEGGTWAGDYLLDISGQPVRINPHFGQPTAYQPPRYVRFDLRIGF